VVPGERLTVVPDGVVLVALGSLTWWCWFNLSFGVNSCNQGGGELSCMRRNLAPACRCRQWHSCVAIFPY
jgi:hypothetical protein